jgi:hypothetical protein
MAARMRIRIDSRSNPDRGHEAGPARVPQAWSCRGWAALTIRVRPRGADCPTRLRRVLGARLSRLRAQRASTTESKPAQSPPPKRPPAIGRRWRPSRGVRVQLSFAIPSRLVRTRACSIRVPSSAALRTSATPTIVDEAVGDEGRRIAVLDRGCRSVRCDEASSSQDAPPADQQPPPQRAQQGAAGDGDNRGDS